jgi:hypothetical protein
VATVELSRTHGHDLLVIDKDDDGGKMLENEKTDKFKQIFSDMKNDRPPKTSKATHVYTVGQAVEIYSWSNNGWVPGQVFAVSEEQEEGIWVQVTSFPSPLPVSYTTAQYFAGK